ncbi:glycosyltransferase [Lusitaniella coriacea]|uniref:glycosyltransferase n=1 Tax=Lusitaniella coriacea TaxID=1983105 RepID=UPI003CED9A20
MTFITQNLGKINILPKVAVSGVSIVIPTYKRVDLCEKLLVSLQGNNQTFFSELEIIIVDNSPPSEAFQIEKMSLRYGARYYWQKIGVGAKRNFGAKLATYPVLLFIDSDCEATPALIQEHFGLYQTNPKIVAVLGRTEFKGRKNWLWKVLQYTPYLHPFTFADEPGQKVWGPSNNFSCRREIFQKIGGFNEDWCDKPGGEDVDFGCRLYEEGHLFSTNPKALVYHTTETWKTFGQMCNRLFNWGKGEFYLYRDRENSLYYDCPKGLGLFLIFIPVAIASAIVLGKGLWLTLPFLFLGINWVSRFALHCCYNPHRLRHLDRVFFAEVLMFVYEIGLTVQCCKERWFSPLFQRLIILPEDAAFVWNMQVLYTWITFAQLVLTLSIFQSFS